MEEHETAVLICGAGPAGLVLAIELARRGVTFRLIDRMAKPFAGSRGKGIQPRSQEMLEDLGVLDRMIATGGLYPPLRTYREDGGFTDSDMMEPDRATPSEPHAMPLLIPQFLSEGILRDRLAELGGAVAFGHELTAFTQDGDGVTAHLQTAEGPQTVRARYLIGTDGGRSFVRSALGIDFAGHTLDARAIVADVVMSGLNRTAWHRFNPHDMARLFWICPLAGTDLMQIQAPVSQEGDVDLSAAGLEHMAAERTGRRDIHISHVSWASAYVMNARLAERYREGRVFLAGDAAHVHPPTGGQGLNTSMQDAYNLGWKLAAVLEGAPDVLLDSYEAERRPVAADVLGLSTRLLGAVKTGEMKRDKASRQLGVGYPDSPLALPLSPMLAGREGLLTPGARAPDAPLQGAAGYPRRLFDLFTGTHWTLLGYEAGALPVACRRGLRVHRIGEGAELSDAAGHFRRAYGLIPGEWALIRPDGYVGAIVGPDEAERLARYLTLTA